jgi:hypothetical protein
MNDFGDGGFDLYLEFGASQEVSIRCPSIPEISINFSVDKVEVFTGTDLAGRFPIGNLKNARVVVAGSLVTIYGDNCWIGSVYTADEVKYPDRPTVTLYGNLTLPKVELRDLSDYREAIYVDFETNALQAYSTLMLGRPIEIYPVLGSLVFAYDPVRQTTLLSYVQNLTISKQDNLTASDNVVYYNDVAILNDIEALKEIGFHTRIVSLPDLVDGALYAAYLISKRNRESNCKYQIACGYSPYVLLGQIVTVNDKGQTHHVIVEDIGFDISIGNDRAAYSMTITGRAYVDQ